MARILIAEDDEIVGEMLVECLSAAGHAVGWVKDGDEALAAIRFRTPDLVILDQHMPRLSGIQVLRAIRIRPEVATIPVMMLTAVSGSEDKTIAYYDGASDYLTKPFDCDELVFRAEDLMRRRPRLSGSNVAAC